jgi:uncharacterized protein (TIRG00374 family)
MTSKTITILLKLSITVGLFYIILTQVKIDAVMAAFSDLNLYWVMCVLLVYPVRLMLQTVRWKILLNDHGVDAPGWLLLKRNWIGRFLSNFLPGRMGGDIYRIFGRVDFAVDKSTLASSVILDRLLGIVALLSYVCVAGVFQASIVMQTGMGNLIAFSSLGIVLIVPWFLTHAPRQWLLRMSNRLPDGKPKKVILSLVDALIEGTRKKRTMVYAFIISVVFHLLSAVGSYCSLRAMGFDVSLLSVVLIIPLVNLIAQVPISLNGLGLREGAFALLFTAVGVPAAVAVGAALVDRAVAVLMSLIGGLMYYAQLSKIQKQTA